MTSKVVSTIKIMRDIRDSLTKKYLKDPSSEERDLERIRRKYKLTSKKKKKAA